MQVTRTADESRKEEVDLSEGEERARRASACVPRCIKTANKREPTQAMIAKLGTIMTTCFFMPSIMPSIALGSVRGLGGAAFSGSIMLPSLSNEGLTFR